MSNKYFSSIRQGEHRIPESFWSILVPVSTHNSIVKLHLSLTVISTCTRSTKAQTPSDSGEALAHVAHGGQAPAVFPLASTALLVSSKGENRAKNPLFVTPTSSSTDPRRFRTIGKNGIGEESLGSILWWNVGFFFRSTSRWPGLASPGAVKANG